MNVVTIAPLLQHKNTIKLYHTRQMIEREGKITAKRTPQKTIHWLQFT
jgi:hypothetical protein